MASHEAVRVRKSLLSARKIQSIKVLLPHFAESHFFSGQASAFCGNLFFVWADFRILRKARFSSGRASAFCGKRVFFRLGGLPHFAESAFFVWAGFRILRKPVFCLGKKPHGAESYFSSIYSWCFSFRLGFSSYRFCLQNSELLIKSAIISGIFS